jgi:hypothetical protein
MVLSTVEQTLNDPLDTDATCFAIPSGKIASMN